MGTLQAIRSLHKADNKGQSFLFFLYNFAGQFAPNRNHKRLLVRQPSDRPVRCKLQQAYGACDAPLDLAGAGGGQKAHQIPTSQVAGPLRLGCWGCQSNLNIRNLLVFEGNAFDSSQELPDADSTSSVLEQMD